MRMKDLSVSDIQMLEILKAISIEAGIIIMDEPTSAITQREIERLFSKITELKARGTCIIYISHKMDEIFRIADDIAILRDGRVVESRPRKELDIDKVISMMVGQEAGQQLPQAEDRDRGRGAARGEADRAGRLPGHRLSREDGRDRGFRRSHGRGTD